VIQIANRPFEYRVICVEKPRQFKTLEKVLNENGLEGWGYPTLSFNADTGELIVILSRLLSKETAGKRRAKLRTRL